MNNRFKFRFFNEYSNKLESCDEYDLKDIFESGNPVMQCTGLKDKNGKLIYEGDIVEFEHSNGRNAVVYWNNDRVSYYVKGEGVAYNALSFIRNNYFIIIGNICENKSLLESEG